MNTSYSSDYQRKDPHPVAAGLLGAVAGAAVGIALASILSDPQKRKIVGKQIHDIQKWGNRTLQDLREKSVEVEDELKEQSGIIEDKAQKIQKELEDASTQMQQKTK